MADKPLKANLKIVYQPTSVLVRNNNNTRLHDREQIAALANSIREFGFTNPILVDADNVLVAGHGRLEAAQMLGLDKVKGRQMSNIKHRFSQTV